MKALARPFRVLITLWAGSLWSLLWVATVLFRFLSDRHTAGLIAARLFSIETYLGLAVAALAVMLPAHSASSSRKQRARFCTILYTYLTETIS